MLARIAHELYWIGRQLARAEHTARMLDGIFHADVQARPDSAGVLLSWDHLLTIVSGEPPESPASRDEVLRALTLDPEHRSSPAVLRAGRLTADLDFRARAAEGDVAATLGAVQRELAQVDADIGQRYFGGTAPVAGRFVGAR